MVDAANSIFDKRPKPFDSICMSIATNPNLSGMMNAPMLVSRYAKVIVGGPLVSEDHRAWQNSFLDKRNERSGFSIGDDFGDHRALSSKHTRDCYLADRPATLNLLFAFPLVHVLGLAAKKTFIGFNATRKRIVILFQHLANLLEHAPRGFVGDSGFTLKLFRRDAATSRRHQIDRVEPRFQRRAGLVIDRVGGRVNVVAAILARIGAARSNLVMLCDLAARFAKDAVRVEVVSQPIKASIIIRELFLEILERVSRHFRAFDFRFCHAQILTDYVPTVKG